MSSMTKRATPGDKLVALSACLARVANDRDKSAFAELFDHYAPQIRAYSLAREPGSDLVADDLVQEVMTRVWLKAASYNPGLANLNTWIFTLARNCRIDYLRRNSRYATEIDPTDMFNEMEDEGPDPFQLAQQSRVEESIREGLKQLPREQSEILTKVYLEGKSHQQASDELKLPLGTVKSRVRLALKKLEVLVVR
ncbi:MAG: sigma-70 family RNA polymerase sigma factor [Gammaproteobacteria bacterium]|jgi:RNA polymerase sigma-70 factor (ECF subfamily)|nr:sigma-70 family RNA polymerase sigma factor [Gammaproteobacteria bacterium]